MRSTPVVSGLPALVFAAWVGTMAMMAFVAVIGPVVRMLGLSEWHAGLSVTAAGVLWMLSARRWGALSDRIGRRRVLLIALAAYAVIYIVMAVFVDTALQAHEQGAAAGAVASVQGLGMVIGPMVGTLLYRAAPSAPYLLVGVVLLGLAAVATLHGRRSA